MTSILVTLALLTGYFLPTLAAARGRRGAVFILNLFLGWTFVFWVIALVMAVRTREVA